MKKTITCLFTILSVYVSAQVTSLTTAGNGYHLNAELKSSQELVNVSVAEQDSLALVALYNATGGDNWRNKTNWLVDSVYKWYGVKVDTIDSEIRVVFLSLGSNNLTGSIPEEIGNLTKLQFLYLQYNQLSGDIPAGIGGLKALKDLVLDYNQLTAIPEEIGNLTELTDLKIRNNKLTGNIPSGIGGLTNLHNLYLSSNQLSGDIPAAIGNLTKLIWLDLNYNRLTCIPEEIGSLDSVEYIYLSDNALSGSIPGSIGNLSELKTILLSRNQLSGSIPSEIGNLTSLEYLSVDDNNLSGEIPPEIGGLSNLYGLYLYSNQLSGTIPKELGDAENLNEIYLGDNMLTGSVPPEIGNLSKLRLLYLWDNKLTGLPDEIGELSSLESLGLKKNLLTKIPESISDLSNLITLNLSNNQLSSIPAGLNKLTKLSEFYISSNQLTELPDLSELVKLYYCNVYDNGLDFGDLEAAGIVCKYDYIYSPQWKTGSVEHYTPNPGDNVEMSVTVDGTNNTYQWYKNDVEISGATNAVFNITSYNEADDKGIYMCEVKNTGFPDLTIESENFYVGVDVTRFTVTLSANPSDEGVVLGEGEYDDGAEVTVEAASNPGYLFVNWTEDGNVVSADEFYTFIISSDRDLVANFTGTTSVKQEAGKLEIIIYPNPVRNTLYLKYDKTAIVSGGSFRIEIYSVTGQKVKVINHITDMIDISGLGKGIYLISFITDKGTTTRKFAVAR